MSQKNEKPDVYNIVYYLIQDEVIKPEFLFTMLEIFWPSFITKDGYVFLKETFDANYFSKLSSDGLNPEYWINLLTIEHYFSNLPDWEEKSKVFAKALISLYRAKLKTDFPQMKFVVEYFCDEEVGDYGLTFYQVDDTSEKNEKK